MIDLTLTDCMYMHDVQKEMGKLNVTVQHGHGIQRTTNRNTL